MLLGLKGKIREIHENLQKVRFGTVSDAAKLGLPKKDMTLVEYLGAKYKEGCDASGNFDMNHLYAELGVDPSAMTVEALINLDQDSRWLVPEIFRDAIRKGVRSAPFSDELVAVQENIAQPQANMPYLELSDAEPEETAEGETIGTGKVSYGNKVVNISKKTVGIEITDEALRYSSINMVSVFIQDVGIKLGMKLNADAINILINGDQPSNSEAAATIGIGNITTGLVYRDILRYWIRASRIGRMFDAIIAGEELAGDILDLKEFKDKQAGTTQQNVQINQTLPSSSKIYVSARVPDGQFIPLDRRFALAKLTSAPLAVEAERIVNKQINGTYASLTVGFANVFRDARVIVDTSLEYASNKFPAWMESTL